MATPPSKILVLAIDAANPVLLRRWAADGTLPHLRSLMSRGLTGQTRSVEGFFIGSTWPSFYTGMTPARHGLHYLVQLQPGTYDFYRPADRGLVRCHSFWSHLSRAGRRVAVLDVPLTRLDPTVDGIHVVEWGAHDAVFGFQAWPPHIAETITSRFGAHPLGHSCDVAGRSAEQYREFVESLVRGVHAKASLTREFLQRGGWDFFMQVFTESHCIGHQCWHLHDDKHPAHDSALAATLCDPIRRIYAAIDTAIGELLEVAGDATIVVMTAHGMSHWYGAQFLLPEILLRLGVARPPSASSEGRGVTARALATARWTWKRIPTSLRTGLAPVRDWFRQENPHRLPTIGVDPETSRCFAHKNGLAVGGIRLNLVGREPQGILSPGPEADSFCHALVTDLLDIIDERTGQPLIRRVLKTSQLYQGDYLEDLPDLLVEWSDEVPTGSTAISDGSGAVVRARSPKIGVIEGSNQFGRTGEHRPEGFFTAVGPGIRPGTLEKEVSILDLAPTLTNLLGVDLPECDGQPIAEFGGAASEQDQS
jgi:predicted AlkP superfamily phosphohydrolase/phosphomutase